MSSSSKLWSTLAIFTLPQQITPDHVSYRFPSVSCDLVLKRSSDKAPVSCPARTHDCLKGGSRQTAEWAGGSSITSDCTLACDSSGCFAGDGAVDYSGPKMSAAHRDRAAVMATAQRAGSRPQPGQRTDTSTCNAVAGARWSIVEQVKRTN